MQNNRILIVDDDGEFADELKDMLASEGYEVSVVSDGMAAVTTARRIIPALVLLDLKLQHRSGFEIAAELRRRLETRGVPIIAMSGFYSGEKDDWLKRYCGLNIFLKKPFNRIEALERIKESIGR